MTFSGHQVEETENQSVLPSVLRVKRCSGICAPQLRFVFYLRETFPDSMSRASHVRLAKEPDGSRLTMAHTCTEKRSRYPEIRVQAHPIVGTMLPVHAAGLGQATGGGICCC